VIRVSVTPSFGAQWLVPRLERFLSAHPSLDIRVDATDALVRFELEDIDVAIRYGRGHYEGLETEPLFGEVAFPVCSPALLQGPHPLRTLDDLRHHTLLHVPWTGEDEATPSWRMWLRAAGRPDIDVSRGPRFTMEGMALQAAILGQGVALATSALVGDALTTGRLVRPFGAAYERETAFRYYLVYPAEALGRPRVAAFREWLLAEAAASRA
jgi:LysR family glycine cleavage system transcriptional activator